MNDDELIALRDAATPGPWPMKPTGDYKRILVGIGLVDGPHGYDVAEVYSDDCDRNEADANARLIAAAPDLAAEVLRLRAREAAAVKLAEALKNWLSALNNLVAFEADNPNNSTKEWSGLVDALEAAENTAPDALAAWEAAK